MVEDFSYSRPAADEWFEISSRKTALFHGKQNSFNWIRQVDGPMFFLPRLYQSNEHVKTIDELQQKKDQELLGK